MKNISYYIIFLLLACSSLVNAQNEDRKWAISVGAGSVLYSESDGPIVGGRLVDQFPRFSVARYILKNTTLVASTSANFLEGQKYQTFDGELRYDFGTSKNKLSLYAVIGGSFIEAIDLSPTANFGIGGTLWISNRFGLNGQASYRYSDARFDLQRSHSFTSAGLVYLFSLSAKSKAETYKGCYR
ncbi:hypothetical protein [uncultured Polaribacter sp.]|uniref:hypothetical protein n=1 Tax=uncultured Polaribacter sp. TaxID=174711 RepID=UPI00262F00F6|nr:hypothetical protein [uncultured Polaribacter sp.]